MARKLRGLSDRPSGVSRHSQGQVSRASMNRMFANAGEPSDGISCHSANPPNRAMKLAIQPISATSNSFKTCRRSRTTRSGGTLGEMSPGIERAEGPDIAFRVQHLIAAAGQNGKPE